MEVKKWIEIPSMEITVLISGEEAMQAIVDDKSDDGWSMEARIKWICNNIYAFFKNVSDEQINSLSEPVRQMVAKAFRKQADRFWKEVQS